jgi:Zn ribbon nucleic-acid-binding protein
MIADELCPNCHGKPELQFVKLDRLVKQCSDCGHRWNEPRDIQHDPKRKPWDCPACIASSLPGDETIAEHERERECAGDLTINEKGYVRR